MKKKISKEPREQRRRVYDSSGFWDESCTVFAQRKFRVILALIICLSFAPMTVFAADRTSDLFRTVEVLVEQYNPTDGNDAALQAYGAGVCAFLLTVPNTDTIYLDEILAWLEATLGGDEAVGWTMAAFDSWSNGNITSLEAYASGNGSGLALGMEPDVEPVDSGQSAAPEAAPPAEAAMTVPTERPEAAPVPSSGGWNGVWVKGGDTLAIVGNGASMYHVDGNGNGLSISTIPDEVTDSEIHSRIYDPSIDYEAEYHLILSGDTLEFTHIYYGASPITAQASGTYTRTGEDADTGYNRLRNKPAPVIPVHPTLPVTPAQPTAPSQQSTVVPTPSKVFVNGIENSFEAYYIDSSNYFKLRDIAFVLNGTAKQFNLGYDSATAAINLLPGQPYIPAGGEMMEGDGQAKTATLTPSKIYLNGGELYLTVYSIGGNNFFKLADLMSVLNIGVTYNQTTGSISLDTNAGFMGVVTVSEPTAPIAPETLPAPITTPAPTQTQIPDSYSGRTLFDTFQVAALELPDVIAAKGDTNDFVMVVLDTGTLVVSVFNGEDMLYQVTGDNLAEMTLQEMNTPNNLKQEFMIQVEEWRQQGRLRFDSTVE